MKIYGHCRFSYLGQTDTGRAVRSEEDAQALLWNPERMAVRFHLLENLMLPSLRAQTDQDFQMILLTSERMPDIYQERLDAAVAGSPNLRVFRTNNTDVRVALRPIMLEANDDCTKPAVHFRLDDDDALCATYIEKLRACSSGLRPTTMITFPKGVMGYTDDPVARHREFDKHAIAIGLALVYEPTRLRTPFQIQHLAYAREHPVYCDPTFPAYHYTRHSTNNTNGYDKRIHTSGGTVEIVARKSAEIHPEFREGAVSTETAERYIAEAFPYTTGDALRKIIADTLQPESLPGYGQD